MPQVHMLAQKSSLIMTSLNRVCGISEELDIATEDCKLMLRPEL